MFLFQLDEINCYMLKSKAAFGEIFSPRCCWWHFARWFISSPLSIISFALYQKSNDFEFQKIHSLSFHVKFLFVAEATIMRENYTSRPSQLIRKINSTFEIFFSLTKYVNRAFNIWLTLTWDKCHLIEMSIKSKVEKSRIGQMTSEISNNFDILGVGCSEKHKYTHYTHTAYSHISRYQADTILRF